MNPIDTIKGKIHSIETCGTVDGPGIRYVIFTQGCPLRCQYCHNPDTWNLNSKDAREMSIPDLLQDILKYKSYMTSSGGGVTVSGGDPLMQKEFVTALFKACKDENIHTALDTVGFTDIDNATNEVLKYTDLVLLDIKSYNPGTFKKIARRELNKTLLFAEHLAKKNINTWIRFVLVPGLSDDEEEMRQLANYITTLKNVEKVGILPFHQMGAYKWEELGISYKLKDTPTPSKEETEKAKDLFRSYGLIVK